MSGLRHGGRATCRLAAAAGSWWPQGCVESTRPRPHGGYHPARRGAWTGVTNPSFRGPRQVVQRRPRWVHTRDEYLKKRKVMYIVVGRPAAPQPLPVSPMPRLSAPSLSISCPTSRYPPAPPKKEACPTKRTAIAGAGRCSHPATHRPSLAPTATAAPVPTPFPPASQRRADARQHSQEHSWPHPPRPPPRRRGIVDTGATCQPPPVTCGSAFPILSAPAPYPCHAYPFAPPRQGPCTASPTAAGCPASPSHRTAQTPG